MRRPSQYLAFSAEPATASRTLVTMESTFLTKRRAVDNCHTATALCRMP